MSLDGSLEDFGLSDVLQLINIGKRTGILTVMDDGNVAKIYFQEGEAVHATLGNEVGERAIYQLFNWNRGTFRFETQVTPTPRTITVGSQNLILEATRRIDEWAKLRSLIPSQKTVLGFSPNPRDGSENITLEPQEWRVLSLIDGRRPVSKIAELSGFNELKTTKILYGLVSSGLLEVTEEESRQKEEKSQAKKKEEEVDKGAFGSFLSRIGGGMAKAGRSAVGMEEEEGFKTKVGIVIHFVNKYMEALAQPDGLYNPVKIPWKLAEKVKQMAEENHLVNDLVVKDGLFAVRESEINISQMDDLNKQEILRSLSQMIDELYEISAGQSNKSAAIRRYKNIYERIFVEGRQPSDLGLESFVKFK
jgi:hypothetical protein